uniref:Midnolin n=1 Tax=Myotis lucifugus TaxID=59463 RepID=G1PYK9_MYOLU
QVSDFLSGRSPLTLALRVGDHMMFVQLQLAAQHAPLQHRHVLAAATAATRGDPSMTTPVSSPCRPVSSTVRVPPVPTSPAPASPSPVTAGSFRSHSAPTTCPEVSLGKGLSFKPKGGLFGGGGEGTQSPYCMFKGHRWILGWWVVRTLKPAPRSLLEIHSLDTLDPLPQWNLCPGGPGLCLMLGGICWGSSLSPGVMVIASFTGDRLRQTENRATRCKVERLQLLLQQKRLRRKARRDARGPYHWPPSRKAGRSDSSPGGSGGSPSEAAGLGLDFEESVWKPEVNPDIKSEFVVA